MGVVLPKPVLSKVVDRVGAKTVVGACCSINGFRNSMEDAHCMIMDPDRMLFGIFDGHSNDKCSQYIAEHMPRKIKGLSSPLQDADIEKVCVDLDAEFLENVSDGGTTGTFCMVEPIAGTNKHRVTIANVGDSRILVARAGRIIAQTLDHKPQNPEERQRIERCGGIVRMNRVDGDLAVSRAFGDGMFKKFSGSDLRNQKVIAVPDIQRIDCEPEDIIVLACDGVFEGSFTNEEVVQFVTCNLPPPAGDYAVVSARVCDQAVRRGSKDNISCMLVHFTDGSAHVAHHGAASFVPGPPYPRTHEASRTAYQRMAQMAGVSLTDALKLRYELYTAHVNQQSHKRKPIEQVAFDMSDEVDIQNEGQFWAGAAGGDSSFFSNLADGGK